MSVSYTHLDVYKRQGKTIFQRPLDLLFKDKQLLVQEGFIPIKVQDVYKRQSSFCSSGGGGKSLAKPRSVSIDVVIKKKISNKKAISAVDVYKRQMLSHAYAMSIYSAQKNVHIVNPYFVPTSSIKKALNRTIDRGCLLYTS